MGLILLPCFFNPQKIEWPVGIAAQFPPNRVRAAKRASQTKQVNPVVHSAGVKLELGATLRTDLHNS